MNHQFEIFKEYKFLNLCIRQRILSKLQLLQFAKNDYILKKGDICNGIFFIEKGCCRTYLEYGGKEITTSFRVEKNIISSAYSYLTQMPSDEYIQALEDTTCYFFSHESIHSLLNEYIEFNLFVRKLYESLLLNEINLLNLSRTMSALERYEHFMEDTPQILQRVPLKYLASFLGMSQETLSRMRGKI
jgi:CRP-like cAMP-binding protein